MIPFFQTLTNSLHTVKHHLCVGIDPHSQGVSPFIEEQFRTNPHKALEHFCEALITASATRVSSVKFQSAFFEAFGAYGFEFLREAILLAKKNGLLVILDNKRGDISSTMAAYGRASFEYFAADAITVTAYMGMDCLEPLLPYFRQGKGAYVVWRTSNQSADIPQNFILQNGRRFYIELMAQIHHWATEHNLLDSLGYVLGGTQADKLEDLNSILEMSQGKWLVPGFGAQGAVLSTNLQKLFMPKQHLVPVSRGLYMEPEEQKCASWKDFKEVVTKNIATYSRDFPSE